MRLLRLLLSAGMLISALACSSPPTTGNDGGEPPPELDAASSTVTVDRATGVTADGEDRVTITVTVKDANGQPMSGVAVQLEATGTDNTLTQPAGTTDANGKATGTLASTHAETKTLRATADGTALTQTATVKFVAGEAAKLSFLVQPSTASAGVAIAPAVQVALVDANGNVVTGADAQISIALGNNASGATLSGTLTSATSGGFAVFSDLSVNKLGTGYTLVASAAGVGNATSAPFSVNAGAPAKLLFTAHPTNVTAGANIAPAVQVSVIDAFGNLVRGANDVVSLALGANPSGASLSGSLSTPAVEGVATFADLHLDRTGQGYTLVATAPGLSQATSASFNVLAGAPAKLAFKVQPSNGSVGVDLAPAVEVAVQDALGNTVANATNAISVALGSNASNATLAGGAAQSATGGVAVFGSLRLSQPGAGYTLVATSAGLASATSAPFDVAIVSGAKLVFTGQPSNVVAGQAITPAVVVTMQDASGNVVTQFSGTVTVALSANPGGATLGGTTTVGAANGVATFSDLTLDKAASGYTLQASAGGATGATSVSFKVSPAAPNKLSFVTQPTQVSAGANISPSVQVVVQDAFGNTASTASNAVTLTIGNNPAGGALTGTTSAAPATGIATFANLAIDKAGTGYTLAANATGLTGAVSTAFDVTPGQATHLTFTTQPTNVTAGQAITPAVVVAIQDAFGNTLTTATDAITVALTNAAGATLTGTKTANASGGTATFSTLSIDKAATAYTLTATANGLSAATSSSFDVTAAAPAKLAFTATPATANAGAVITPAVKVAVQDSFGNTVPNAANAVTLAIGTNPANGTLSGTTTVAANSGIATFSNLTIDNPGQSYTLSASSSGLTSATSAGFDVTYGAPAKLVFSVQPASATAGAAITPAMQVTVQDAFGNTVGNATTAVTLAIGTNPSGGALSGTTTVNAVSGVATFAGLSIDKAGASYTLAASAQNLTGATSTTFAISPGAASALAFSVQPSNLTAGVPMSPAVKVTVQDALGNTVTSSTASIVLGLGANPGAATLTGGSATAAVNGVATFSALTLDKSGSGYTLSATSSGLSGATSTAFDVSAGPAATLVFSTQPSNVSAGASITPAVKVSLLDAFGNVATGATNAITVALGTNPANGTLTGTLTTTASAGVATFPDLKVDHAGSGYTLQATSAGLMGTATSNAFAVNAGPAAKLAFAQQPTNAAAGAVLSPAVTVKVQDSMGNDVTSGSFNIHLALSGNTSAAELDGVRTVPSSGGVSSYGTLTVNRVGTGYTLNASAAGLTSATSAAFDVTGAWSLSLSSGPIESLAVHPTSSGTIWAGTMNGLFRSDDTGATWSIQTAGLSEVKAIAIEGGTPDNLYAGGLDAQGTGALLKSSDGGRTWTTVSVQGSPQTIAVDGSSTPALWVGTGQGLYRSIDRGVTFTQLNYLQPQALSPGVTAIALDPSSTQTAWVATNALASAGRTTALVAKTTTGGTSWSTAVSLGSSTEVRALAVDPTNSSVVWAGTEQGLYRSTNGGGSFSAVSGVSAGVHAIAISPSSGNTVYVASDSGLFVTTNGGVAWTSAQSSVFLAVAIAPSSASTVVGGSLSGVVVTTTAGVSWSNATAGIAASKVLSMANGSLVQSGPVVLAATYEGVYSSTNNGATWTQPQVPLTAVKVEIAPWQTAYIGTVTGGGFASLWMSPDGQQLMPIGQWQTDTTAIATVGSSTGSNGYIVASTPTTTGQSEVYYSGSMGSGALPNWLQTAQNLPTAYVVGLALRPTAGAPEIYACVNDPASSYGLYVLTSPTALAWQPVTGVPATPCTAIAADPASPGGAGVWVAMGTQVYWGNSPTGFIPGPQLPGFTPVISLTVSPPGASGMSVVYAGIFGDGVYRFDPGAQGGAMFQPANLGIADLDVTAITAPTDLTVFAGSYGRSVFKTTSGGL